MTTSRRRFLGTATAFGFTATFGNRLCQAINHDLPTGKFKRCLVLWMNGGPSQLDTFDPKTLPGARPSVATQVPGLRLADSLAGLAARADQMCVIRSIGSREGEHVRATELMHTGFAPLPSFPRPSLGALISHGSQDRGLPRNVTLGGIGFGPAFLGAQHGPFVVADIDAAKVQLSRVAQRRRALGLLKQFNQTYAESASSAAIRRRAAAIDSVERLLDTALPESLDLNTASDRDRQRYGDHLFGKRVLTARRLLGLGVPLVEAQLDGWDTHLDNERRTGQLCRVLEQPWIALMDDLQQSGMWDDTLVVWMGEFGRTPRLNGGAGRDHFPEATPVVLCGGDLGGRLVGQTSDDGARRVGVKHNVADLMATVMTLMGLDPQAPLTTDFGSPTTATDEGTVIDAVIA